MYCSINIYIFFHLVIFFLNIDIDIGIAILRQYIISISYQNHKSDIEAVTIVNIREKTFKVYITDRQHFSNYKSEICRVFKQLE